MTKTTIITLIILITIFFASCSNPVMPAVDFNEPLSSEETETEAEPSKTDVVKTDEAADPVLEEPEAEKPADPVLEEPEAEKPADPVVEDNEENENNGNGKGKGRDNNNGNHYGWYK